jgi:hypothetical protein
MPALTYEDLVDAFAEWLAKFDREKTRARIAPERG